MMIHALKRPFAVILLSLALILSGCGEDVTETQNKQVSFILNRASGIFHLPDCPSAGRIKERNKASFSGTREEAIALGYTPCRNCKP